MLKTLLNEKRIEKKQTETGDSNEERMCQHIFQLRVYLSLETTECYTEWPRIRNVEKERERETEREGDRGRRKEFFVGKTRDEGGGQEERMRRGRRTSKG